MPLRIVIKPRHSLKSIENKKFKKNRKRTTRRKGTKRRKGPTRRKGTTCRRKSFKKGVLRGGGGKRNLTHLNDKPSTSLGSGKGITCAPHAEDVKMNDFTCYTTEALQQLKSLWNARKPSDKISVTTPHDIWKQLNARMASSCSTERCWLKQEFAKDVSADVANNTFSPEAPSSWLKNPNEWLSSVDITKVMKQYEFRFKCFNFIGPTPIDFDKRLVNKKCVWEELCQLGTTPESLTRYINKGVYKIGIIFNTDPHTKDGEHWISLFINFKKKFLFYFDSNGSAVPKEVKALVDRVIAQAAKLPTPLTLTFAENAPLEHQFGNTECGMYSLYVIACLLKEKAGAKHNSYQDFCDKNKLITDADMTDLRPEMFYLDKDRVK